MKKNTIESVAEEFHEKGYTLVSQKYKNKNEKLEFTCNKHPNEGIQLVSLASFRKNKNNCCACKEEAHQKIIGVPRPLPKQIEKHYEKFFEKYKNKLYEEVQDEYTLLDITSQKNGTTLHLRHNTCGSLYDILQVNFFIRKYRCRNPQCKHERLSKQKTRTHESIVEQIYNLVQDEYEILSTYEGSNTNMTFKHNVCDHEFQMSPHNFIFGGQRCPVCAQLSRNEKLTKTHEEFIQDLENKYPNEYEVLDNYAGANAKIRFLHKDCGHITCQSPTKALSNLSICKFCDHPTRGEQKIIDFLDSHMIGEYEYQQYYDGLVGVKGGDLSYDFYIPKYNLLIEYQGEYHDGSVSCQTEEEFKIQKEHDNRKRKYAESHGINLLEIWYWDFDNIENILTEKLALNTES